MLLTDIVDATDRAQFVDSLVHPATWSDEIDPLATGSHLRGGDVFVLDMGDPVHIVDLAKKMIRLSGYTVKDENSSDGEIEILYTGLRPGEKLYEELLIGNNVLSTAHDKIMRAEENVIAWCDLQRLISQLQVACDCGDFQLMRDIFATAVSGYSPQCDVVDEITLAQAEKFKPSNIVNFK